MSVGFFGGGVILFCFYFTCLLWKLNEMMYVKAIKYQASVNFNVSGKFASLETLYVKYK